MKMVTKTVILISLFTFKIEWQLNAQCLATVTSDLTSKHPYQPRSNRCEGFYIGTISAPTVEVVGFTKGALAYRLLPNEFITIRIDGSWQTDTAEVHSVSIPLKFYYRMDAYLQKGRQFKWSLNDVIVPEKILPEYIGVFGLRRKSSVYLPLVIENSTGSESSKQNETSLLLRCSTSISQISWRYSKQENGQCSKFVPFVDIRRSFDAGEAIEIILPKSLKGQFCIEAALKEYPTGNWIYKKIDIEL